jgi:hypothetical protein
VLDARATGDPDWPGRAACADADPERWWPSADQRYDTFARGVCATCPVIGDCRDAFLNADWPNGNRDEADRGIWAGLYGHHLRAAAHQRAHNATADPTRIALWWARWPTANVAVPTGREPGFIVVDLDGLAGRVSWQRLCWEHGVVPDTAQVATPHGAHLCYRLPSRLEVPRRIGIRAGLDILTDHDYALVPPSANPCTRAPTHHEDGPCTGLYTWTRPDTPRSSRLGSRRSRISTRTSTRTAVPQGATPPRPA